MRRVSQVEENDFRESNYKKQNLEILSRHFRRVSIDILEDLYEKCHQDIEWTTNLLLDSGERLYKEYDEGDDDLVPEEESCKSSTEPSETVMGSESVQARPVLSDDSKNSSGSSISLKSPRTNLVTLAKLMMIGLQVHKVKLKDLMRQA